MPARSAPARNDACHRIARTRIIRLGAGSAAPDRRGGGGSRADLGRGILLGLELLVAADIIGTVAVTPTLRSLAVPGLIVLIRTFLSFSLEVEGRFPWRAAEAGRRASGSSALDAFRRVSLVVIRLAVLVQAKGLGFLSASAR
jgi:hypothetical protein